MLLALCEGAPGSLSSSDNNNTDCSRFSRCPPPPPPPIPPARRLLGEAATTFSGFNFAGWGPDGRPQWCESGALAA